MINRGMRSQHFASDPLNIAAVANLYCVEKGLLYPPFANSSDLAVSHDEVIVHRNILQRMIDIRGGIHTLTSNRLVYALALW